MIETLEEMHTEWVAWRSWCKEFSRSTGQDINDPHFNDLAKCVRRWGEELVALRLKQEEGVHTKALAEYREETELFQVE